MALFAHRLDMHPGQRKARLRVIEPGVVDLRLFPILRGVALCAARAEPALMGILMAGGTFRRKAHPGVAQVLLRKDGTRRGRNVLRGVAGPAAYSGVSAIQRITGRRVVEALHCRRPVQHVEVFAIVVGVALGAIGRPVQALVRAGKRAR